LTVYGYSLPQVLTKKEKSETQAGTAAELGDLIWDKHATDQQQATGC